MTKEQLLRQTALDWWNSLHDFAISSKVSKSSLTSYYIGNDRRFSSLTGSEVEDIFKREFTPKGVVDLLLQKRKEIEDLILSLDDKALINYELEQLNN